MSTVYSRFVSFLKRLVGGILFQGVTFIIAIALIGGVYAAWQTITSTEIAPGEKVTSVLFNKIKGNLDDLNGRVTSLSSTPLKGTIVGYCSQRWGGSDCNASGEPAYCAGGCKCRDGYTLVSLGTCNFGTCISGPYTELYFQSCMKN